MSNSQALGQIFKDLFRDLGIARSIEQHGALAIWDEVVGERVAGLTQPERIERGILTVRVNSPVWRNELVFMKADIVRKINETLNKDVVKDIKFT